MSQLTKLGNTEGTSLLSGATATGTAVKVRNYATPGDEVASNPIVCDSSFYVEGTTGTVGHRIGVHFTAEAEI